MGSIILEEVLQLNTKRVVQLKLLIIILRACCAPSVKLSAQSRTIILVLPGGSVTFFCANVFICSLTTSIPLSSEALSSRVAYLNCDQSSSRTMQRTLDVLPTPGGPANIRLGIVPWATQERSVLICSTLPQTSLKVLGLYFSSQIYFMWRQYYKYDFLEGNYSEMIKIVKRLFTLGIRIIKAILWNSHILLFFMTYLIFLVIKIDSKNYYFIKFATFP